MIVGKVKTAIGDIPKVATKLTITDFLGHVLVRFTVKRMDYKIDPGLYAVGNPNSESPVFVSANYKYSFDHLRKNLDGLDGWILVLDTKGINVWCAAGKGTFGTDEIVNRVKATRLPELVKHRKLILPQLGAPGVKYYEVKKQTGFTSRFGPVRANDIPQFLENHLHATPEMRMVRFNFFDRLLLVPEMIVHYGFIGFIVGVVLQAVFHFGLILDQQWMQFAIGVIPYLAASLAGAIFVPLLLPWLPGRSFSLKGSWIGLIVLLIWWGVFKDLYGYIPQKPELIAWVFLLPALSSFVAMNFTGSSTYTSLSGVRKEMKYAVKFQAAGLVVGLVSLIVGKFV